MVQLIVNTIDDRRGRDITVLDLSEVSDSLDYFILATGDSTPQLRALEESVREKLKEHGELPRGVEGPSDRWILIDYGTIVVHLMSRDARTFYDLEGLWAEAEKLDVTPVWPDRRARRPQLGGVPGTLPAWSGRQE